MKKVVFLIIVGLLFISNVHALEEKVTIEEKNIYHIVHNPKTGVNNLKKVIIPVALIGTVMAIDNYRINKGVKHGSKNI